MPSVWYLPCHLASINPYLRTVRTLNMIYGKIIIIGDMMPHTCSSYYSMCPILHIKVIEIFRIRSLCTRNFWNIDIPKRDRKRLSLLERKVNYYAVVWDSHHNCCRLIRGWRFRLERHPQKENGKVPWIRLPRGLSILLRMRCLSPENEPCRGVSQVRSQIRR